MWILFDVGCVAFLFSLLLTPLVRDTAVRLKFFDSPDSIRKLHSRPIPRLGGMAVAIAYGLALLFILIAPYRDISINIGATLAGARALVPAALLICFVGILDDIVGLRPWHKLAVETIAAVWAYYGGFGVYVLRDHPLSAGVSLIVSVVWLVGCTNAMNMIDGMDGLAAGVAVFASITTVIAALINQNIELALVTAPLAGSLIGFLRYNFNPASIFLGDSGSLLIGFLLGCYGALWGHKSETLLGMTAPLMALSIPLLDATIAIVRRYLRNKPIFGADRGHIHHRLLDQGLRPRTAALLLYAVCGLAAVFSLLQDVTVTRFGGLVIVLFCAVAWIGVQHLGYVEFDLARKFLLSGSLRKMIDVHVRVQEFERALGRSDSMERAWTTILGGCVEFGFCGVEMDLQRSSISHFTMPPEATARCWQLRVPFGPSCALTLYRDSVQEMHPVVLSEFAEAVRRRMNILLDEVGAKEQSEHKTAVATV